ncbi:glycosyltransferase [Succinispira mobilis]|uniref:glycosyltransferase n=1 Tax=Succinispira mobilis TaxID=78120 RepID=UPI0003673694|nr:glycosyltransferase [Succinispira mobilis]
MDKLLQEQLKNNEDILVVSKKDRRVLSRVPDKAGYRKNFDRRLIKVPGKSAEETFEEMIGKENLGRRYLVNYPVKVEYYLVGNKHLDITRAIDISTTGILLETSEELAAALDIATDINLKFEITPGSMPEGYEMQVDILAKVIRSAKSEDGKTLVGLEFTQSLAQYANKKKNRYLLGVAALALFIATLCIMLMRAESVLYFKFNKTLYTYSIIAATFLLTRYLFAVFYRPVPIDKEFTPGVSIIIPCFNEVDWIERTIVSCINQDYPLEKLEVIVVDDCSIDGSYEKISAVIEELKEREKLYDIENRVSYIRQEQNAGKREAMGRGALLAKHDLLVFVDSDSFLDPYAIRNIVQPFKDADMGGVSGRTDVANTYTNALTKMQAVRYYISFRIMKAAESYFDAVTCLSGPLACYRKDLVLKYLDPWLEQKFFGERATFGDDRSMTNFILREHRTTYQDTAICSTIVPNTYSVFLKQQMRWKRSWLRESLIAASFMWKKEPFMALSFYMGVLVPIFAPFIVLYNLIYIPLMHRVFPVTFVTGIFLMALLMSMAQLLLKKSTTWVYGLWFVAYYEAVLLWQMPIAWFTFWKNTWGTRLTPADIEASMKKKRGK